MSIEASPQPQLEMTPEAEGGFDREETAREASGTARKIISEQIDDTLQPEDREKAVVELMKEMAEDNGNRFIVEAMAQQLSYENLKSTYEIQREVFASKFPYVTEAANDDLYDLEIKKAT